MKAPILESVITNPLTIDVKYAWGNRGGAKLFVAANKSIKLPYDVYTESDPAGRANLLADLTQSRVVLYYVSHGVESHRVDKPAELVQPQLAMPVPASTISDAKTMVEPKPQTMSERVEGPSENTFLANEYDTIGRTGSIDSAKPERVSPLDDEPQTRDAAERIVLDDWDGALQMEQAAAEAAQAPTEVAPEDQQLHQERQAKKAKKGRR